MESTYPSAPGNAPALENDRVRFWSTLDPGGMGDTAVTNNIIRLISERSPSEKRLPGETNGHGTFVDGNSGRQQ